MFSKWRKSSKERHFIDMYAPLTGQSLALEQVPDEAFAGGLMGKGIAVDPTLGKLVAPFDATVAHVIKSRHALILEHASGLQMLLHIGVNTVSLKGEGFIAHVSAGDQVKSGQPLIDFDIESIRAAGYPVITSIVVTNADEVTSDLELFTGPVTAGGNVILKALLKA